jgi:hypothetical protein
MTWSRSTARSAGIHALACVVTTQVVKPTYPPAHSPAQDVLDPLARAYTRALGDTYTWPAAQMRACQGASIWGMAQRHERGLDIHRLLLLQMLLRTRHDTSE